MQIQSTSNVLQNFRYSHYDKQSFEHKKSTKFPEHQITILFNTQCHRRLLYWFTHRWSALERYKIASYAQKLSIQQLLRSDRAVILQRISAFDHLEKNHMICIFPFLPFFTNILDIRVGILYSALKFILRMCCTFIVICS